MIYSGAMIILPHQVDGVVIFDGECVLCNRMIARIARADRRAKLAFASRKSPAAARLLAEAGVSDLAEGSVVFIARDGAHSKSAAVCAIGEVLGFPYSWAAFLGKLVPLVFRDTVYGWIARSRIRLFGATLECALLPAEARARLLQE